MGELLQAADGDVELAQAATSGGVIAGWALNMTGRQQFKRRPVVNPSSRPRTSWS